MCKPAAGDLKKGNGVGWSERPLEAVIEFGLWRAGDRGLRREQIIRVFRKKMPDLALMVKIKVWSLGHSQNRFQARADPMIRRADCSSVFCSVIFRRYFYESGVQTSEAHHSRLV